jgi:hypothetical protein
MRDCAPQPIVFAAYPTIVRDISEGVVALSLLGGHWLSGGLAYPIQGIAYSTNDSIGVRRDQRAFKLRLDHANQQLLELLDMIARLCRRFRRLMWLLVGIADAGIVGEKEVAAER